MKKIIIASKNPVKIQATKNAFEKMFPEEQFQFDGVSVPSNVADQPMGNEETLLGATNRAQNAHKEVPEADFWVGLEGGLEDKGEIMEGYAWMVVIGANGKVGKSRSASFELPNKVVELVKQGYELSHADDMVFSRINSKHQDGAAGILTHGVVTRADFYEQAVVFALVPFANPELY